MYKEECIMNFDNMYLGYELFFLIISILKNI